MKILNLFAGLGGNRELWENVDVLAIENNEIIAKKYQEKFPEDQVLIMDVYDFLRDKNNDLNSFFLIWLSPPCQTHSQMMKWFKSKDKRIPIPRLDEIYGLHIWLLKNVNTYFCIENVQPWYKAPIEPTFKIKRHSFWSNFKIHSIIEKDNIWKHGKIGGVMRNKNIRDQYERNKVEGWIGKYILDSLKKIRRIEDFF